jgi:hypothetical protein
VTDAGLAGGVIVGVSHPHPYKPQINMGASGLGRKMSLPGCRAERESAWSVSSMPDSRRSFRLRAARVPASAWAGGVRRGSDPDTESGHDEEDENEHRQRG